MNLKTFHPGLGVITPLCDISLFPLSINHHIDPNPNPDDYVLKHSLTHPEQNRLFL